MTEDEIIIAKFKKITLLSLGFMTIELLGGYYAHSIAIMADAFHLLSDVIAYMISLWAVLLRMRKTSSKYPFGFEKAQPLGALVNVAIIWIVTFELFMEATNRLINKELVEKPLYMFLTSIFGLCCNIYILRILHEDPHSGHHCSHDHGHGHGHGHSHGHGHENNQHDHEHHHHNHNHHEHELSNGNSHQGHSHTKNSFPLKQH